MRRSDAFTKALDHYWQNDFKTALTLFKQIASENYGSAVASIYVERCEFFITTPPNGDWDGVWSHSSK
jgi:adenylate cyclase